MAEEEKQEPEKPKKEKSGLPFPLFGLVGFAIVLIALIINVFLILGIKSEVSSITEAITSGKINTQNDSKDKKSSESADHDSDSEDSNVGKYVADEKADYFETGRITTNPRASTSFVVLNLGVYFTKGDSKSEGGSEGEGKKEASTSFSPFGKKFDGMVKNIINSQIGNMSLDELQIPRDSLSLLFKQKLKPLFSQQEARLKDVAIVEFIVQ